MDTAVVGATDEVVLMDLAWNARDAAVRKIAIGKISDQNVLAKVAIKHSDPASRKIAYEKLSDQQRKSEVLTPYDGIPNDAFSIPASREGGSFVISRDHVVRGFSLRQIHDREISVGLGQDIRKERKYYDLSTGLGRLNATFFLLKSHTSQFSTSGLLEIDWTEGLFSWGSGLDFNIAERGEQI